MTAVVLQGVTKRFGETQVLSRIDAEIPTGAFAVLVGPSGCGKSTLLRLLAGLEEVTSGTIRFDDRDVTTLAPRDRDLAMVFQSYALYPHMTVRDNLAFGLRLRKTDSAQIVARVDEAAKTLGLENLLDRYPRALSGGQRQRVAMGRAIVRKSKLFLFDEPLSNLDPALRTQVRVDIRKLHDRLGATSIYVTHDQVEAMTLADVLFVLDKGVVQQTGAPIEVYRRPVNTFVARFVGSPSMNLLPGVVVHDASGVGIRVGPTTLPLPPGEGFDELPPDAAVTLGVRPHDVQPATDDEPHLDLRVEHVETMGPDTHAHTTIGDAAFVAVLPGTEAPAAGTTLRLRPTDVHVFDAESGASLRA
jgi:sn-glycerol 3-phosphate transport system ATP-binding protein/multiple sugar transport system ATP-binding protein